ncbi:MAG: pyridoxal phosphate-dependent aminotransferase [Desulfobacterota bacterium]|nr:pyridoxal phosphate-dependent aminotransferase [Thermodesulfobacteriota bacterium]MDW8002155.1 pyridoxal phosphate-dependent aminotransferase [Deltaproteobacteria bacterium]
MISGRAKALKPSPTLAISAIEKSLKAKGVDVAGFGAGEPDFPTPEHIKAAAIKAITENFTKYTPATGTDELKDAVIEKFKRDNGLTYSREEVIITCGGKHALFNLLQAIIDEGDEVIIPVPYWVSYPPMVELCGGKPVFLETHEEENFEIDFKRLKTLLSTKTKAIILNYPSNPAGSVYSVETLRQIGELAVERNLIIISDEIYEKIAYDSYEHVSIASIDEKIKERTIICHGVSKTYSMTGWRIGFAAGNKEIIKAMGNIQSQSTSNPTSISQAAALSALTGPQDSVTRMVEEFKRRRDYIVRELNSIPGIKCFNPKGAFYVFPNFKAIIGKRHKERVIDSSTTLTQMLLEDYHVAVVPGIEFGKEGYLRLSFATSMDVIQKGIERIQKAVEALS